LRRKLAWFFLSFGPYKILFLYSFIHSFIHLFTHLFTHLSVQSFIYLFIHSFDHSFTNSFICLFVCLFISLFVCMLTYLSIFWSSPLQKFNGRPLKKGNGNRTYNLTVYFFILATLKVVHFISLCTIVYIKQYIVIKYTQMTMSVQQ